MKKSALRQRNMIFLKTTKIYQVWTGIMVPGIMVVRMKKDFAMLVLWMSKVLSLNTSLNSLSLYYYITAFLLTNKTYKCQVCLTMFTKSYIHRLRIRLSEVPGREGLS